MSRSRSDCGKLGFFAIRGRSAKIHENSVKEYLKEPKLCAACGKELPYDKRGNKFCSSECKNSVKIERNKIKRYCVGCGTELLKYQKKFCSNKCQGNYKWTQKRKEIEESGKFDTGFGNEASRVLVKKYLIEKYGRKCSICGITEWMGKPVPVVVDHIDGDPTNCKIDNFRLVCGNCDMQLPTYKSKNKHGRKWRAKYST